MKKDLAQAKKDTDAMRTTAERAENAASKKEAEHRDEIAAMGRALDAAEKAAEELRRKHRDELESVKTDLAETVSDAHHGQCTSEHCVRNTTVVQWIMSVWLFGVCSSG